MNIQTSSKIVAMQDIVSTIHPDTVAYYENQYAIEVAVTVDGQEVDRQYMDWLNYHNAKLHQASFERSVRQDFEAGYE